MSDIGNRDPKQKPTWVGRIVIQNRTASIIVITRIGGINGDQRQFGQIIPIFGSGRFGGIGLCHNRIREGIGNPMLMNGDQGDRFRC